MKKRKNMSRWAVLAICTVLIFGLLAGCNNDTAGDDDTTMPDGQPETPSTDTPPEQTGTEGAGDYREEIVIGLLDGITNMNPQETNLLVDKEAITLTHDTLVFMGEGGAIEPGLAVSSEMIDLTTWEFKLREGVLFHNGDALTASDVVYTFEKAMDAPAVATMIAVLEQVVAIDDYTVQMKLESPCVDWLAILYDTRLSILSENAISDLGEDEGARVGTGAYRFKELVLNDHLTVEKFEDAWEADKCPTKRFVFKCIPEDSARVIALQTGEVDVCLYPASTEIAHIAEDDSLKLVQLDSNGSIYIGFNMKDEVLGNQLVREAISYAIDRDEIIAGAVDGLGTPTRTLWASSTASRYDGFEGHTLDLEKAQALLEEAGYADGFSFALCVTTAQKMEAVILQAQLKRIGIDVVIEEMDSSGFTAYLSQGVHQAWIWGYNFSDYSDNMRNAYATGMSLANRANYSNARVDELFDLGVAEPDEAVRDKYYQEIQEIAAQEMPFIAFYYQRLSIGINAGLEGVIFQTNATHNFKYGYIAE